jgi:hypothetical protein
LLPNSPLIDAGAFLTRTLLPGAGPLLPVVDAFSFTDGFGIPGERGDWIQLEGQTEPARVLQVDYLLNTLLLDRSVAWTIGQGVSLAFNGRAPDVGALETISAPIRLEFSYAGSNLQLTWPVGRGLTLVASTTVDGAYEAVAADDGSYSEPFSASARFFQLRTP